MPIVNQTTPEEPNDPYDPHHLWDGLGIYHPLPYAAVLAGFARFLVHAVRVSWDHSTPIKQPWYLVREEGLKAWCLHAAKARLAVQQQPTYTLVQFHRLIFSERMRRGGKEAMSDPVWTPLFEHMQRTQNLQFFRRLPYLFNQKSPVANMGQFLFCLHWDRASIPLEYWSTPAAQRYLLVRLGPNAAPMEEGLRVWANRLGLVRSYPLVVTIFDSGLGIPPEGFHLDALEYHGIPYEPPTREQNISQ
jgi:hypothetical protein